MYFPLRFSEVISFGTAMVRMRLRGLGGSQEGAAERARPWRQARAHVPIIYTSVKTGDPPLTVCLADITVLAAGRRA